jgi:Trypsin-like peptidase domain
MVTIEPKKEDEICYTSTIGKFTFFFLLAFAIGFDSHASVTDQQMKDLIQADCRSCTPGELQESIVSKRLKWTIDGVPVGSRGAGVHKAADGEIPLPVKKAAASTFEVVVISGMKNNLHSEKIDELREQVVSMEKLSGTYAYIRQVMATILSDCETNHQLNCEVPTEEVLIHARQGSAFLVGQSGQRMLTAGHVIRDLIVDKLQPKEKIADLIKHHVNFEIFLFDSSGKSVVTPLNNTFHLVKAAEAILQQDIPADQDFAEIEFENRLDFPGLMISSSTRLEKNTTTYSLGFPSCTGCDSTYSTPIEWIESGSRYPFEDSPGGTLEIAVGALAKQNSSFTLVSDIIGGMSGGPTILQNGEVIGINVKGVPSTASNLKQTFTALTGYLNVFHLGFLSPIPSDL